ncbi:MAG: hypothetical protein KAW92_07005 [Candidatus Cloacimonetes bacterium]|nr:hypothetical protein [Candidatus Cloacimonadota bacterium]
MSFKDIVNKKYEDRVALTAPVEPVDALTFVTSHKWLGERPFPFQSLLLKLLYKLWEKYPITEKEQELIDILKDEWSIELDLENRNVNQVIDTLILVIGRRGSKSSITSWIAAYEAYKLICKGNPQKYYKIRERHPIHILNCASDGEQAKETFNLIKENIKKLEFFQKYIDFDKDNETELRLFSPYDLFLNSQIRKFNEARKKGMMKKNILRGSICIESITTSAATKRGKAISTLIFDEFAHFGRAKYRKKTLEVVESPQTDHAMWVALTPSVKDFGDDGLIITISSPVEKIGEFYGLYCLAGGKEQNESERVLPNPKYLMLQLSTWQANPKYKRENFDDDYRKDPNSATMEYGAHFGEPASSFLNPEKVDEMVVEGAPILLKGRAGQFYVITVDPASKSDTYAIAWGHRENRPTERYWIDGLKGFEPTIKKMGDGKIVIERIDPDVVMDFLLTLIANLSVMGKQVMEICYDQWNSIDSINKLRKMKLPAFETTFTNSYKSFIFGTFLEQLNQGNVFCYGIDESPVENWPGKLKLELKYLQKLISGGTVYYAAPTSGPVTSDDFAVVVANLIYRLNLRKDMSSKVIRELHKNLEGMPISLDQSHPPIKGRSLWTIGKKKDNIRDRLRGKNSLFDKRRNW